MSELAYFKGEGPWVVLWSESQQCPHVETLQEYREKGPGVDYYIKQIVDTAEQALETAKVMLESKS